MVTPARRAYNKDYYAKNRQESLDRVAAWRQDNMAKVTANKRTWGTTLRGYLCIKIQGIKARSPGCSLTYEQLHQLYTDQVGKCALTGRKLLIAGGPSLNSLSVDRLDQSKEYTINNIRLVTWQANSARHIGTDAELVAFCRDVLSTIDT